MAKLTDDPKVAEAIEKAEARGANGERKRINALIADFVGAEETSKEGKASLRKLKSEIRATT